MRNLEIATNEHYHVFNRGVGKQVIFHDLGDYTRFLFLILHFQFSQKVEHLSRAVKEFSRSIGNFGQHSVLANEGKKAKSVELVSFCIMPSHFHLLLKELEENLDKAMKELPEQCRTIFQMSRFEELKYLEIAAKLGISVKTVENQMGKALRILRLKLVDFLPTMLVLLLNL